MHKLGISIVRMKLCFCCCYMYKTTKVYVIKLLPCEILEFNLFKTTTD